MIFLKNIYDEREKLWKIDEEESPIWEILGIGVKLFVKLTESRNEMGDFNKSSLSNLTLIQTYTHRNGWWQVDQLYLELNRKFQNLTQIG